MKICWHSFLVIKTEIILHILLKNTINRHIIKQTFLKVDIIKELSVKEWVGKTNSIVYADEADVLNMALFGMTAKEWRDIRKHSTVNL